MGVQLTKKQFEEKLEKKVPNYRDYYEVLIPYYDGLRCLIKTKYGNCTADRRDLLRKTKTTIQIAVDKDAYFANMAREVHGDLFDYSELKYKGNKKRVNVICKKHGLFTPLASSHLAGNGCKKCFEEGRTKTQEQFLKEAEDVHGNLYDYSLSEYVNSKKNVLIICKIHGGFYQTPKSHVKNGQGCPECARIRVGLLGRRTTEEFIRDSIEIHGGLYDYSESVYVLSETEVDIICPIHGKFQQVATSHLTGSGCPHCAEENKGWSYHKWKNAGNKSANFDGFKVYVIKCEGNGESFYKIGKTFSTVGQRFALERAMPYEWELIKEFRGSARKMSELEVELQRKNKKFKYEPKIEFGGRTECFSKIIK